MFIDKVREDVWRELPPSKRNLIDVDDTRTYTIQDNNLGY